MSQHDRVGRVQPRLAIVGGILHFFTVNLASRFFFLILAVSTIGFVSGCKTMPWKKEKDPNDAAETENSPQMKIPVGTIHLVDPSGKFVLIRSSRFLQLEPGMVLTIHGNGGMETARVKVSPARKGQFLTADILSGNPRVGEQTLMDYTARMPEQAQPGQSPLQTGGDDVQVLE